MFISPWLFGFEPSVCTKVILMAIMELFVLIALFVNVIATEERSSTKQNWTYRYLFSFF